MGDRFQISAHDGGSVKRQKLSSDLVPQGEVQWSDFPTPNTSTSLNEINSRQCSIYNRPTSSSSTGLSNGVIVDIEKYIPAGCLRVQRDESVARENWAYFDEWDVLDPNGTVDSTSFFIELVTCYGQQVGEPAAAEGLKALLEAKWIRTQAKANYLSSKWAQIRVYILPDDVGRSTIDRRNGALRTYLQNLLPRLDASRLVWDGGWPLELPIKSINPGTNADLDNATLFQLFNTLPSPSPNPEIVQDLHASIAMDQILSGDVEGVTTELHPFQCRTAAMMVQRETQPAQTLDPRLREVKDATGRHWYLDAATGTCLREPRTYEGARGGICAETMGLGKTLICLTLILATREHSSHAPIEYSVDVDTRRPEVGSLLDMAAAAIGRLGLPWKTQLQQLEDQEEVQFERCREALHKGAGYYFIPAPEPRRASRNPVYIPPRKIWLSTATLVVVPPNLVQQWLHEIKKHTIGLKVLVMKSSQRPLPPANELTDYDIILFSRQRFDQEHKSGADHLGRRAPGSGCHCPYIGSTRTRDCTCFDSDRVYRSPLHDLHFKRLITDEGHTMGNSTKASKSNAVVVIDQMQVSARWVISGTPTQGLYGADAGLATNTHRQVGQHLSESYIEQERRDLEKLGNIAVVYLKTRPWSNGRYEDPASWSEYVMQPRHGPKSHGNMECLRTTLAGMIIRHLPEDVLRDVKLPALHHKLVYLDGSLQDKISINLFSLMITCNAVTSERKDADYLFHPSQRKALAELVGNLRQASFFWSGFTIESIETTIKIAQDFLEAGTIPITLEDRDNLQLAITTGEVVAKNYIAHAAMKFHEMPIFLENQFPHRARQSWSLDGRGTNPTLFGITQLRAAQKFIRFGSWDNLQTELEIAGKHTMDLAKNSCEPEPQFQSSGRKTAKISRVQRDQDLMKQLAGGVSIGSSGARKSMGKASSVRADSLLNLQTVGEYVPIHEDSLSASLLPLSDITERLSNGPEYSHPLATKTCTDSNGSPVVGRSSSESHKFGSPKNIRLPHRENNLSSNHDIAQTEMVSTASAKLSYLLDRILEFHEEEKIIVFYEADNVAYYIAQALEALSIEHLIYATDLSTERRARYIVTFNETDKFRVLLMDITQAAFGLNISAASRIYFVNPCFNPQVEAQAVKRAHRIGQTKPVFVETLILKETIEEKIVERRNNMSSEEHQKCKTLLDDQAMYEYIRNSRFLPLPDFEVSGPAQMAALANPQRVFGKSAGFVHGIHDPNADIVLEPSSPTATTNKKGKGKAVVKQTKTVSKKIEKGKTVRFA